MNDAATSPAHNRKTGYLIIVDSDPADLSYTSSLLQNFGYTVHSFRSAEEAMRDMTAALPALIITELNLPAMKGFDFLTRVKNDPKTSRIPVIIQNAVPSAKGEEACRYAGCADYLHKPVLAADLYRAIQAAIEPTPRRHIRIHVDIPVFLGGEQQSLREAQTRIIVLSEDGLYIKATHPCPPQARLPLRFSLKNRLIVTEGLVLYSFQKGQGPFKEPGMGMRFIELKPDDKALIQEYVGEIIVQGLPKDITPQCPPR